MALVLPDRALIGATGRPVLPPNPHLLIAQRPSGTFYAGYWEFPGGKIEPGEAPEVAAVRECREELGIEVVPATVLPQIIHTYSHAAVQLHPVLAHLDPASPPPQNLAVADHRWCPIRDLPWAEFLPANVRIITALQRLMA